MVRVACALGAILLLVGTFVGCAPSYTPSLPTPNPTQPSPQPPSPPPSSAPPSPQNLPGPTQSPNPPLNVTIDYIGIKNAYTSVDRYHSNVKIIVAVNDGKTNNDPITIPPASMTYFETREINQRVFQTSSVGDYLKVSIVAYNVYNRDDTLSLLSAFEKLGQPVAGSLKTIVESLPKESYIGYYDSIWYPADNWGIGSYEEKGVDNFRVWLRIWSGSEPPLIPKPEFLPNIKVKDVTIPSPISLGKWGNHQVTHKFTLENNENFAIAVKWAANSSVTGDFDSGTVDLPGNGYKEITKQYMYDRKGTAEITYTIYYGYNGKQLDQRTVEVSVMP
jgi:hypothetical protein